ncbi:hypothetical protein FSP39_016857 [Pinctada imbricata]|uniref:Uncharacterized protein n=1 Tax=Pinctada imbricata TaxID=66713 RepID=A0AA88YE78_PINIB|nr:hypothetical protein FSP39_016857 [Pinctada imbricata]
MERLLAACQHGTTAEIIDLLTSVAINSNFRDEDGRTLMYYACQRDLPLVVEALCQHNFKLEQVTRNGKSALHVAAFCGSRNVVDLLTSKFPPLLNVRCSVGLTAIHSAVEGGQQDMFHRLLAATMNPRAVCFSKRNILHLACEKGHYDLFMHLLADYNDILHMKAYRDWGMIHFAAVGGNIQIMHHLIKEGFNILQTTSDDTTPLHFACSKGKVEMVKFLIAKFPNQLHLCDSQGYQAVHHCASGGDEEMLQILERAGAEVEKKTKEGLNVLHIASHGKNRELVKHLADNFPNLLTMNDDKGRSVLFTAAEGGSVVIMEFLTGRGVDPHTLSINGSTILHLACAKANKEMVEVSYF